MVWEELIKKGNAKDNRNNRVKTLPVNRSKKIRQGDIRREPIYKLGSMHGNAYFTKREAECMACLLKGMSIKEVAAALQLSPRTAEYYIGNMRSKVSCKTKAELIEIVKSSDFSLK